MYVIVWEFDVKPDCAREFEEAYGPEGIWAAFFKRGKGYRWTQLLKTIDRDHHYVTMDYWVSREDFESFKEQQSAEYEALDEKCKRFMLKEVFLGAFDSPRES